MNFEIFSAYSPSSSDSDSSAAIAAAAAAANASGVDPDFASDHDPLMSNAPLSNSSAKQQASLLSVPAIPCWSAAVSDATVCAACIICEAYLGSHVDAHRPRNYLAVLAYFALILASAAGALKFAGQGGEFVASLHPQLASLFTNAGLPCLALAFVGLTLPLVEGLQALLLLGLLVAHVAFVRCGPRFASFQKLIPLPSALFILYTCLAWSSYIGITGVALFFAAGVVGAGGGAKPPFATVEAARAAMYVRMAGAEYLRVDVFHYLLAPAMLCLAHPLVHLTGRV